jgi:hypothetical protein
MEWYKSVYYQNRRIDAGILLQVKEGQASFSMLVQSCVLLDEQDWFVVGHTFEPYEGQQGHKVGTSCAMPILEKDRMHSHLSAVALSPDLLAANGLELLPCMAVQGDDSCYILVPQL